MKKKRIISILLASAICVTFIGCGKKNDSSNVPDIKNNVTSSDKKNGNTDSGDDSAKSLKTLNNKQEVLEFSKEVMTKVENIFKKNNLDYTVANDYLRLAYKGQYKRLGEDYDVEITTSFAPYHEDDNEDGISFQYRIPFTDNTDVTKLNIPQLNVIADVMIEFDEKVKGKYNREQLLKRMNDELKGDVDGDRLFEFGSSNIKSEADCRVLSGGIELAKAKVKGNVKSAGVQYTFEKYDDYISIVDKGNKELTAAMKNCGLKDVVVNMEGYAQGKSDAEYDYRNETYCAGMEKNDEKSAFNIVYSFEGQYIPFDAENNKIKDTKYIEAIVKQLNSSEIFKNKFSYDEFMNEIYKRTQFKLDDNDCYQEVSMDGVKSIEVAINGDKKVMGFKIIFESPATVEGQTER